MSIMSKVLGDVRYTALRAYVENTYDVRKISGSLFGDNRAAATAGSIVDILILFVIMGALLGTAFTSYKGTDTNGWSADEIAVYGIIGILALLGIAMGFMPKKK